MRELDAVVLGLIFLSLGCVCTNTGSLRMFATLAIQVKRPRMTLRDKFTVLAAISWRPIMSMRGHVIRRNDPLDQLSTRGVRMTAPYVVSVVLQRRCHVG